MKVEVSNNAVKAVSGEIAIAAVDLLRMPVAIEPGLVSELVERFEKTGLSDNEQLVTTP